MRENALCAPLLDVDALLAAALGLQAGGWFEVIGAGEDFTGAVAVLSDLGDPGRPFCLRAGEAQGHSWVDVEPLRFLHAEASRCGPLPGARREP